MTIIKAIRHAAKYRFRGTIGLLPFQLCNGLDERGLFDQVQVIRAKRPVVISHWDLHRLMADFSGVGISLVSAVRRALNRGALDVFRVANRNRRPDPQSSQKTGASEICRAGYQWHYIVPQMGSRLISCAFGQAWRGLISNAFTRYGQWHFPVLAAPVSTGAGGLLAARATFMEGV